MYKKILTVLLVAVLLIFEVLTLFDFTKEETKEAELTLLTSRESNFSLSEKPDIDADYIYVRNTETKEVYYAQREYEIMYPASLTKMMSAILAIENIEDYDKRITITNEMVDGLEEIDANKIDLLPGDTPTVLDCLYGTMLNSAADCVNALAVEVSGSIESFVDLMNEKAKELGMNDTHFVNPTGMPDDNHYSTAYDMALLVEYCIQNEMFIKIASTIEYDISEEGFQGGLHMVNYNAVLYDESSEYYCPGIIITKSGYTGDAGFCMASYGETNGVKFAVITCHAGGYYLNLNDTSNIYNWMNEGVGIRTLVNKGDVLCEISVEDTLPFIDLKVVSPGEISFEYPLNVSLTVEYEGIEKYYPGESSNNIGKLYIKENDEIIREYRISIEDDYKFNVLGFYLRFRKDYKVLSWLIRLLVISICGITFHKIKKPD